MARSEKASRLYKDQPFLFDSEDINIEIENPCPAEISEELIEEEDNKPKTKKSGRKSLSSKITFLKNV